MKNISRKKLVFVALAVLAVCAIIVLALFAPLQRTAGVHIGFSIGSSQGAAENNIEIELIKMNGTFWNYGDITAKNLTAAVISVRLDGKWAAKNHFNACAFCTVLTIRKTKGVF